MLSPSDFNNAVPQFTNGNYASNPINPQYIAEPDSVNYNRGAEPLQTLPAQWWNWFLNKFTGRFNKVNIYVKNIFNELTQLLSLVSVTPSGTEGSPTVGQLKDMFENKYPSYLALLMYPVGSIYWTGKAPDDGGDPNELFGGTWVQIKGKFVWAKGDGDTLNATGGEKTHTLTTSEIPSHTHSFTPAGSVSGHTHSFTPAGTVSAHTHSMNEHTHSFTPSGTVSSHSHIVGSHSHGLNSHTHTIPAHIHGVGTLAASSQSLSASFKIRQAQYDSIEAGTNCSVTTVGAPVGVYQLTDPNLQKQQVTFSLSHGHTISGSTANSAELTSGTATGSTANSTEFYSGSTTPTFTGTAGTTSKATGNTGSTTPTFTGTDGNTGSTTPTFTGTAGTTGSSGGGGSHNNMPPYVVKYCWERTA